jgi:hypothetical protein
MQYFDAWEEAARASVFDKAVSDSFKQDVGAGRIVEVEIIKPLHGDPWAVLARTGFPAYGWRPNTSDVDRVRRWKRY